MKPFSEPIIRCAKARAYRIPTDRPEADGTFAWTATTIVVATLDAGDAYGIGYTYTDASAAALIERMLAPALDGRSAFDIGGALAALRRAVRNVGRGGVAATAISALDAALWDAKAKLLGLPLAKLLGGVRDAVPVYGSGGFTSYDEHALRAQLEGWRAQGLHACKIKVGSAPRDDPARVRIARDALGGGVALFVDANGAFAPRDALAFAQRIAECDVRWFEEPVSADDIDGLRFVRERLAAGVDVAAGEYGYTLDDFRVLLASGALDVLQADATRCGGVSGFLEAATLADAFHRDLSAHCAPALHRHVCCAAPRVRHVEWFHDHARIERMLFDGAPTPRDGAIAPDMSRPGLGIELKAQEAARFAV